MAFHGQKQEPAWTPQPGRADMSLLAFAQCLMHRDLRASQELPGLRHPHPLAFAQKSSLQERDHGTPEGKPGRVTRIQQGHKLNTTNPAAKPGLAHVPDLTAKRAFSWSRTASEQHSWMGLLGKISSKAFTTKSLRCPARHHSHLGALCHWKVAAGQSTLHPWAHGHSLSMEKQNQRHPRCSGKVRGTEKALQEEQLCKLEARKGLRHPWQAWDCGSSLYQLGSPYISPWEVAWRK